MHLFIYLINKLTGVMAAKKRNLHQRENAVRKVLSEKVLPGMPWIQDGRYSWIRSPKTGEPLQLDVFFPSVKIPNTNYVTPLAVEVQGIQHTSWEHAKFFFRRKSDWEYYRQCDSIKEVACIANNIPLLIILPDDPIDPDSLSLRIYKLVKDNLS